MHPWAGCMQATEVGVTWVWLGQVSTMVALPQHPNVLPLLAACTRPPHLALVTPYCARGAHQVDRAPSLGAHCNHIPHAEQHASIASCVVCFDVVLSLCTKPPQRSPSFKLPFCHR